MSNELFKQLVSGDRAALARAITYIESTNPNHAIIAGELVKKALHINQPSVRIGITGVPGVGKSTFINSFGAWLVTQQNKKVCVLAIDPSSNKSHGSILGDKTRMENLSSLDNVFVRPTPAGGNLGGIALKTRETILLCEAAGYDTILVETVGVGQNEYVADGVVDCLLLLLLPNAGDELQGIKRGIMELADIVVLNKADITDQSILNQAQRDLANALHYLPNKFANWNPPVLKNSMNNDQNSSEIWKNICLFMDFQMANSNFYTKRNDQKKEWLTDAIRQKLESLFFNDPAVNHAIQIALQKWIKGDESPNEIAERLILQWKKENEASGE